jgi:hypothetical protein
VNFETRQALDRLEQDIQDRGYEDFSGKLWHEFDVMVCPRENEAIRRWRKLPSSNVNEFHHMVPQHRVIETGYARELSWLFEQLRHIHVSEIERRTHFDFYAELAETAILFIEQHRQALTALSLLQAVLTRVQQIYR